MTTLLVHVGRSKTGSTAIQEFLRLNADALARAGVHVPRFFAGANHADLYVAHAQRPGIVAKPFAVDGPADAMRLRRRVDERLRQELPAGGFWVFSSEHLSNLRTDAEIRSLTEQLRSHADRVVYLAFVRRPDHFLPSSYAEAVKNHSTLRLDAEFVRFRSRLLNHRRFADRWLRSGGDVVVAPFAEDWAADQASLYRDLLERVTAAGGPVVSLDDLQLPARGAGNPRLSAPATEFLRQVNERRDWRREQDQRARNRLVAALHDVPGDRLLLTPAAYRELLDRDLAWGRLSPQQPATEGDAWQRWFSQPAPQLGPPASLPPAEFERIRWELAAAGVDIAARSWIDRLPAAVTRPLLRAFVHRTRW